MSRMLARHKLVSEGSAIAALDYSLRRWEAFTRYLDDGYVPIGNNWLENQIRPWAISRSNWLFAGSLRAGQRAAAIMSLIRSAQLNRISSRPPICARAANSVWNARPRSVVFAPGQIGRTLRRERHACRAGSIRFSRNERCRIAWHDGCMSALSV